MESRDTLLFPLDVTILEMFRDYYFPELGEPTLRRYLAAPISIRARAEKEKQLQKLIALR